MAIINGTAASETLAGTAGADIITGDAGHDTISGGAGNDLFVWEEGDGDDQVEGGAGDDTFQFNGAAVPSTTTLYAWTGGRNLIAHGIGTHIEFDDVERVELRPIDDSVYVRDLRGTDVKQVLVDLSGKAGGTAGDGLSDSVSRFGTDLNDAITVASTGSKVSVTGLSASVTITHADAVDHLTIDGVGGDDIINASKLTPGTMQLFALGGAGNDRITASKGDDSLGGGEGNDVIVGDDGNDRAFLGAGNDLFLWSVGDGDDTVEGGAGLDTLRMTNSNADELFVISANAGYAWTQYFDYSTPGDDAFSKLNEVERIELQAQGGADTFHIQDLTGAHVTQLAIDFAAKAGGSVADNKVDRVNIDGSINDDIVNVGWSDGKVVTTGLAATVNVARAGKADILRFYLDDGDDIINAAGLAAGKMSLDIDGGYGDDLIFGSAGNDLIDGGEWNDIAYLGAGNDLYVWSHGDDTVDGQDGTDTARLTSYESDELVEISASGERAQVSHEMTDIVWPLFTLDLNDVERIILEMKGGADKLTVNDLAGTDVKEVAIDLSTKSGADGEIDTLILNAADGSDTINIAPVSAAVSVTGLAATVTITGTDATDSLRINGNDGNDKITASSLPAGLLALTLDGGVGNDTITGSRGNDLLHGWDDNDIIAGDDGVDSAFLGDGDDLFLWNPGDGNDVVEGQDDLDTLRLTGSKAAETIAISANVTRTVLTRDAESLDLDGVERIEIRSLGGADTIAVNDLAATAVTEVAIDLAAASGGKTADPSIDTVTVQGSSGKDDVELSLNGSRIVIDGLAAEVVVDHAGKTDRLILNAGGGDDVMDASALAAGKISLQVLGGLGADTITGSAGNDFITWSAGDGKDSVQGGAGTDIAAFNGDNAAEDIRILESGGMVQVLRNFVTVADLDAVEQVRVLGGGSKDQITVNNLAGTDTKLVAIDLADLSGVADGYQDFVFAHDTGGNDKITIAGSAGVVSVSGLAAQVTIAHADANDILNVVASTGNDTISATSLPAGALQLSLSGGAGNDVITGGAGADTMDGGSDNDTLRGGAGSDSLLGSSGNDHLEGGAGHDTLFGGDGDDVLLGGAGSDVLRGGQGNDSINVSTGHATVRYTSTLDGHDLITGFDGNAAGGQDTLDLDALFDNLGVLEANRAGRVSITDNGASVEIMVDLDNNTGNGFELAVATLKTADVITIGQDILVGN